MAAKTKAAPAAAKKAAPKAPVAVESVSVSAAQDGACVVINGVEHTLSVDTEPAVVESVDYVAAGTRCAPFLVALTAEPVGDAPAAKRRAAFSTGTGPRGPARSTATGPR